MSLVLVPSASMSLTSPGTLLCHQLLFERGLLFAGSSNGSIAVFRRRVDKATRMEQVDTKPLILEGHAGCITRLILAQGRTLGTEGYLLISASADRTIRVWDPSVREKDKSCIQTLRAHDGTVTSIAFCEGVLVSGSTDGTVKLWKQDEGRDLMLYPWFMPTVTLKDPNGWVNDVALQMGEAGVLFVGDEYGDLSAYKIIRTRAPSATLEVQRWRRQSKAHALGIFRLHLIVSEQMLITSGYDHTARLWDSLSGAAVMVIENAHRCRFTCIGFDTRRQELLLGDANGFLHCKCHPVSCASVLMLSWP